MATEKKHTYPSMYPPGPQAGWELNEAWSILDQIKPGTIPDEVRAYLAGRIAGTLMRVAKEGPPKKQPPGRVQ